MSKYSDLIAIKKSAVVELDAENSRIAVCPDMGGRIFAELCGRSMHRIDLETVADSSRDFNNFGGLNLWPAPEGGKYGFNYSGDRWWVQPAINNEPFRLVSRSTASAKVEKTVVLTNRAGTNIEVCIRREVSLSPIPGLLKSQDLDGVVSYMTKDALEVMNEVSVRDGLIAAWTLEQFDASEHTTAFTQVSQPRQAINFDFYEHPGERITYYEEGFTYKTDGEAAGQIGIKKSADASFIGYYNLAAGTLCLRENLSPGTGLYFNIADNDQPDGPFSAEDNYSIFNSNSEMRAFELETIGAAEVEEGRLMSSTLSSKTTFAIFRHSRELADFIDRILGRRIIE